MSDGARRAAHGCRPAGAPRRQAREQRYCTRQRRRARMRPAHGTRSGRAAAWSRRGGSASTHSWRARARDAAAAPVARADECQHRVDVVEAAEARRRDVRAQAATSAVQRWPVSPPRSSMRHSSAEASIRSATSLACPARHAGRTRQRPIGPALREVEQRQVPPAVRGHDGVHVPARDVLVHPAHPGTQGARSSRRRAPSRGARARRAGSRAARRGAACSARRTRRIPRDEGVHRQHSAVARQLARPCRQHRRDPVVHARATSPVT